MRRALALMVWLSVVGVASSVVLPELAHAQQGEVILSIDGLIFEQANDTSRVIMRVRAGERFVVLAEQGDWLQVQLPRGTGWVLGKIVRREGENPPIAGFGEVQAERVTIVDEYADVKAGPGDAYLGTRRAFRGDTFVVAQRSEDGDWVQVRIDGELGWIRADQLMAAAAVAARPGGGGGAGKGKAVVGALDSGSGGGGAGVGVGDTMPGTSGADTSVRIEARLQGSFQLAQQYFGSNSQDPRLQRYVANTSLAGTGLFARAWLWDYVGVQMEYDLGFGSPIEVPFLGGQTAEVSNTTHRFHGGVTGRYAFGEGKRVPWVGVSAGYMLHRFSIQELLFEEGGVPLFLTNTYTGVRTGLEANVPVGPLDIWASGWLVVGAGLEQESYTSGDLATIQLVGGEGGVGYELSDGFGFFLKGTVDNYDTSFTGPATRDGTLTGASSQDRFISFSTGVLWRPL